jgi:hypothetical protein
MMTGVLIQRLPLRRGLGHGGFPSTAICPATCLSQQTQQQFQQL